MKLRPVVTVGALATWSVLVSAGPALADKVPDDGEVHGDPLSMAQVLLIYVGLPILIIAVIWLLASLPSMIKAPRYRPGVSWWAAPVWFHGRDGDPATATAAEDADGPGSADSSAAVGGTSARW